MSNLANGRVILKFSNSVFVQKSSSLFYSNFILNFYIVFELNNWLLNATNNFALKNCLFGTAKFVSNTIKSKFTYIVEEYHLKENVFGVLVMTLLEIMWILELIILHHLIMIIKKVTF